jgi:hypothetical protein
MRSVLAAALSCMACASAANAFTVGYSTAPTGGSYSPSPDATLCTTEPWTMPQDGTAQSISMYFPSGGAATGGNYMGIYSDSSSLPANKLAQTSAFIYPTTAGFITVNTLTNPVITSGSTIWLCFLFGSTTSGTVKYDSDAANVTKYDAGGEATFPNPVVNSGGFGGNKPGLYATFNTIVAGSCPPGSAPTAVIQVCIP